MNAAEVSNEQWRHRLAHLANGAMWGAVTELAAMLRGYMSSEHVSPVPSWPREASANVALEVARDALEQNGELDRIELFDDVVDCERKRHTWSRKAPKRVEAQMNRYSRQIRDLGGEVTVNLGAPQWWHSTAWGGDGSHGSGRGPRRQIDDIAIDANGDIIPAEVMQSAITGCAVGDSVTVDGEHFVVVDITPTVPPLIAIGPSPRPTEKPRYKPARTMSPQMEREKKRNRWRKHL